MRRILLLSALAFGLAARAANPDPVFGMWAGNLPNEKDDPAVWISLGRDAPGPFILQGDHSGCDFRNMTFTPIVGSAATAK